MTKRWRQRFQPLIAATIAANAGKTIKEVRKALSEAFPCGEHKYHPWKIWSDECRVQLGLKKPKPHPAHRQPVSSEGQQGLFDN